jgi:hypothetical protein
VGLFATVKNKKAACAAFLCAASCKSSLSSLCARLAVLLAEFFDATGSIHDLLGAGVERVALGANFNVQRLAQGGPGREFVAAAAVYGDFIVFRMGIGFHFVSLALSVGRGGGTRSD